MQFKTTRDRLILSVSAIINEYLHVSPMRKDIRVISFSDWDGMKDPDFIGKPKQVEFTYGCMRFSYFESEDGAALDLLGFD